MRIDLWVDICREYISFVICNIFGHEEDSLVQTVYISHALRCTVYKIASVKVLGISGPKWHISHKLSNF
jgi:hypothetical protein